MKQLFSLSTFFFIFHSSNPGIDSLRQEIETLSTLTQVPQTYLAKGSKESDNPKAIYFDALPYEGKNTRTYAWVRLCPKRQD